MSEPAPALAPALTPALTPVLTTALTTVTQETDQRRSPRLLLDVPLLIRGESLEKKPFQEETFTISISATGALVLLAAKVAVGQRLVLISVRTRDEQEGRVARFGPAYGGLAQVAVEFASPAPEFWPVVLPLL